MPVAGEAPADYLPERPRDGSWARTTQSADECEEAQHEFAGAARVQLALFSGRSVVDGDDLLRPVGRNRGELLAEVTASIWRCP